MGLFSKKSAPQPSARPEYIEVGQIVFIGDRMEPDGNDYPAAKVGTRAVKVNGPADTVKLCGEIIARLSR